MKKDFRVLGFIFLIIFITSCSIKEHEVSELTECSLSGLDCSGINFDVDTNTVSLYLYNRLPDMDDVKVSIEGCESDMVSKLLTANEKNFFLKNCNLFSRKSKFTEKIIVTYKQAGLTHEVEGIITGK